jgi:hypothetical protein
MGIFQTLDAVGPDPGMQLFPGKFLETEAPKEIEAVGEDKDLFEPQGAGLLQAA